MVLTSHVVRFALDTFSPFFFLRHHSHLRSYENCLSPFYYIFSFMAKGAKCRSKGVSGTKKGGCQRTLWKGGLCRKCHRLLGEEEMAVSVPRKKTNRTFQKGEGPPMTQEYVHLAHTQMSEELSKKVMIIRADAWKSLKGWSFLRLHDPPQDVCSKVRPQKRLRRWMA